MGVGTFPTNSQPRRIGHPTQKAVDTLTAASLLRGRMMLSYSLFLGGCLFWGFPAFVRAISSARGTRTSIRGTAASGCGGGPAGAVFSPIETVGVVGGGGDWGPLAQPDVPSGQPAPSGGPAWAPGLTLCDGLILEIQIPIRQKFGKESVAAGRFSPGTRILFELQPPRPIIRESSGEGIGGRNVQNNRSTTEDGSHPTKGCGRD